MPSSFIHLADIERRAVLVIPNATLYRYSSAEQGDPFFRN
jgi:hypothetical protein